MIREGLLLSIALLFSLSLWGQQQPPKEVRGEVKINGEIYNYLLDECGDTIILAQLTEVPISSSRTFANADDYRRYRRYRRYAYDVYPYAAEAIRIFRELEEDTDDMSNRKRRRHIKDLQQQLKEEFEDPLKDLTKLQGMILFKMIEKELDTPMYYLIKDLRNGLTAFYWNTIGSLWGHHLKDGYVRGVDPILDMILDDINLTYEATNAPSITTEK